MKTRIKFDLLFNLTATVVCNLGIIGMNELVGLGERQIFYHGLSLVFFSFMMMGSFYRQMKIFDERLNNIDAAAHIDAIKKLSEITKKTESLESKTIPQLESMVKTYRELIIRLNGITGFNN